MSLLKRNSDIVWRVEKQREAAVAEALEAGSDPGEQGTVLLIVSGTMHQLNMVVARFGNLPMGLDLKTRLPIILLTIMMLSGRNWKKMFAPLLMTWFREDG